MTIKIHIDGLFGLNTLSSESSATIKPPPGISRPTATVAAIQRVLPNITSFCDLLSFVDSCAGVDVTDTP